MEVPTLEGTGLGPAILVTGHRLLLGLAVVDAVAPAVVLDAVAPAVVLAAAVAEPSAPAAAWPTVPAAPHVLGSHSRCRRPPLPIPRWAQHTGRDQSNVVWPGSLSRAPARSCIG